MFNISSTGRSDREAWRCISEAAAAGVDKMQPEKEAKLKETLTSLQRLFAGLWTSILFSCCCRIHFYVVRCLRTSSRLMQPTQRKYETAASVILDRNIDAVVVDKKTTAIECIKVCSLSYLPSLYDLSLSATIVYAQSMDRSGHVPPSRHLQSQAN
jgi:hypothetical protein